MAANEAIFFLIFIFTFFLLLLSYEREKRSQQQKIKDRLNMVKEKSSARGYLKKVPSIDI